MRILNQIGKRIAEMEDNMKIATLKQAVEHIELEDDKKQQMIRELKKGRRTHHVYGNGLRWAAVLAVCILSVGILSVPVRALVSSLVQERMEVVPKEEMDKAVELLDEQNVGGDGYSRPYTEAEKSRMEALYELYQNGTFPAGEIPQVDNEEEAEQYEFCFLTTASVFYLPADREMTDEEILQKIDFEYKRNYALQERYEEEHAGEIAAKEAEVQEQITQAVEAGGVTEEQAVEVATEYLKKIYGLDGSGLELDHYYDADAAQILVGQPAYSVDWSDVVNHRFYNFMIGMADGRLLGASYTTDQMREQLEAARPAIEEAPGKIEQIKEVAKRFLTENMGIQEAYESVRSCYRTNSEGSVSTRIDVLFVKENKEAHLLECSWDGTVISYSAVTEKDYEDQREMTREVMARRYTEEYGREVTVENVWT